jgi:hypothetical protein
MMYYVYDQDGFVAVLGNSATLEAICEALKPLGVVSADLIAKGQQEAIVPLLDAIESMDTKSLPAEQLESLTRFHAILEDCVGIVIISDGAGIVDETGEVYDCTPEVE